MKEGIKLLKCKRYIIKIVSTMLIASTLFTGCSSKSANAGTLNNTQTQSTVIESYFTTRDGNLDKILIREINSAQQELDVAIYTITKPDIANAIVDAKNRNVAVKIITDKENSQSKYEQSLLNLFKKNNIPVKVNSHEGLMHLKLTIIDGKTVLGGSYNYTKQATENNDENLLVIRDKYIVSDYMTEFAAMWSDTKNYMNY